MIQTNRLTVQFLKTRERTEQLCRPLEIEDYVVQPIVEVSPPKWHLGHSSWFFEAFLLLPFYEGYEVFDPDFAFLFNSYYEAAGDRLIRTDRGNMTRPSVEQVYAYRDYVTKAVEAYFNQMTTDPGAEKILEIGIHHEQQHQELLLTDIKYILGHNPLFPTYRKDFNEDLIEKDKVDWIGIHEGVYEIGHNTNSFCYDNELGRHRVFLEPYQIANRLVTTQEYLEFMEAGGYGDHRFWHAEGIDWVRQNNIEAPMYWHKQQGKWYHYTLGGLKEINKAAAVTHISYFEAYAFANWCGCRLPTEFEWEVAQSQFDWGSRWEWTESAYLPYPGFAIAEGALGEYNGKFMVNQKVLRGASVATSPHHSRPTYRNFFHPQLRWQFTGIRLSR